MENRNPTFLFLCFAHRPMQRLAIIGLSLVPRIDALTKTAGFGDIVAEQTRKPHIIFALADDLGWHDVGFHGGETETPFLDRFSREGRHLTNYYAQPTCSPTRATILTGRHTTSHGITIPFDDGLQMGLTQSEDLLPQVLAGVGYKTHAIGKWHLGFFKDELTPTFKGFDSFYGFYGQGETYSGHLHEGAYDFRFDKGRNCGSNCSIVDYNASGSYSTTLFTERAKKVITDHDETHPLFLYLAWQAVHAPSDSMCPEELDGKYGKPQRDSRFSCAVALLDQSFGEVVAALYARGMLKNTLIIFSSDNGGATSTSSVHDDDVGSSNWPLRGGKHTLFEGGVRVAGFVWAGWWNASAVGGNYDGLMGTVDWLPTILDAVSVEESPATLEGVSHWPALSREGHSPRTNLFISVSQFGFGYQQSYAFRDMRYKLIVARPCTPTMAWGWSGPYGSSMRLNASSPHFVAPTFNQTLLYDLEEDRAETQDLSDLMPVKVQDMLEKLKPFMKAGQNVYVEPSAAAVIVPAKLVWGPWA